MRRVTLVSACVLLATMMSHAQTEQSVPMLENETSDTWFVELASSPTADGTAVATLEREEAGFHSAATRAGARYTKRRHFRGLWNGLSVNASPRDAALLRALPGVQAVYPVARIDLHQQEGQPGAVADLITALNMTGVDVAQGTLGLSGRRIKVAVIDTGVDYNHPDLGGCFGRGCRVEKGFDFVGDAFNANPASPSYNPTPVPDPDPDDCNGHGTHVSGIIGANGGIVGVAPDVTFHAYRVFGCEGSTTADVLLDAMEMALDNRADVVNMSIGAALQWPQYPTAQAADRLVSRGVVVVASIGNEGTLGLYGASAPGVGKDVIGVASFDNRFANLVSFTISPDGTRIGYIEAAGAPPPPLVGSFPMARTGTATSIDDACAALPAGSLTGRVALIRRGTCAFGQKAANAQTAGAAGVVIYNNVPGFISATVAGFPITIPVVTITAARGVLIDGRLAVGPVTMTWTSTIGSEPNPTGGLISSFSSYGLPPDLSFKPDLGAPGGTIRSTLPLEQGGYGNLSGTSMSSPHVAGAVALLLEARPHASPTEVQERLQNTARPALWWGNPGLGFLDNVHRQGAGMLTLDDAVLADAIVSPSSLALGEIETGTVTKGLRISLTELHGWTKRHGLLRRHDPDDRDVPVTYTLSHEPALATGSNTFVPAFVAGFATVTFSQPTVSVGGHGRKDDDAGIDVTFAAPGAVSPGRLFGGYIKFTPDDGGAVLRVPYTGYNGDYQAIVALTPTANGFPWLAQIVGPNFVNRPAGATYTLVGDDIPFILLHLDHQVRRLTMEVFNVATGASAGFATLEEFLPRNSTATSFFAFTWDGTTISGPGGSPQPVPDGQYRIDLSLLKALGNPSNPAHVEGWPSPQIGINRP